MLVDDILTFQQSRHDEKCQQQQKTCVVNMPGEGQYISSSSRDEDGWNLSATDAKSAIIGRNAY